MLVRLMGYRILGWCLTFGSSQVNFVCRPAGAGGGASKLQWAANRRCVPLGVEARFARWLCCLGVVWPHAARTYVIRCGWGIRNLALMLLAHRHIDRLLHLVGYWHLTPHM